MVVLLLLILIAMAASWTLLLRLNEGVARRKAEAAMGLEHYGHAVPASVSKGY